MEVGFNHNNIKKMADEKKETAVSEDKLKSFHIKPFNNSLHKERPTISIDKCAVPLSIHGL